MRITANAVITQEEKDHALYSEEDWDNMLYRDLTIKFAQELRKMNPLLFKAEEREGVRYQIQGIVISMHTFKEIMYHLEEWLPYEKFEVIKSRFNNTI